MTNNLSLFLIIAISFSSQVISQVPVGEEPFHRPVFQNKYIRLLDVCLQAGDTSQFHIHATPSLFAPLSNTYTTSQIKGKEWTKELFVTGKAWYRSFSPDILNSSCS